MRNLGINRPNSQPAMVSVPTRPDKRDFTVAAYHPESNGQAERYVQTIKKKLKTTTSESGDINLKLCGMLMQYRKVPNTYTNQSLAEMLCKGTFRTRLDLVKRDTTKQACPNTDYTKREFQEGDRVLARFYNDSEKWKTGNIVRREGRVQYAVNIDGNVQGAANWTVLTGKTYF